MKSMLCMLRKTASTIPFYRYHRFIGISCHTPAVSGVHSPSPIIKRPLCGRHFPLAHHQTPAVSGVHSPSPNQSRPRCERFFPLSKSTTPALCASIPPRHNYHICRRQMSIPPRHLWRGGGATGRGGGHTG